jgi:hypothetical protein
MPCFVRRWTAREGHEPQLGHALVDAHEAFVAKSTRLMEGLLYRERGAGREFFGVAVYDRPDAVDSPEPSGLLASLDPITGAHAERGTDSLEMDPLFDLTTIGRPSPHGLAGVLVAAPGKAVALTGLLIGLACEIQHRLALSRLLVGRAAYTRSRFFVLLSSPTRIDLDDDLRSSLGREHVGTLRPLLSAPPRWYALDPVWQYFRRETSSWRGPQLQAARDLRERAS